MPPMIPHDLLTTAAQAAGHDDGGDFTMMFNTVLVVGITVFILIRQFTTREVNNRMYFWIAILIARGCVPPGPSRLTAAGLSFFAAAMVISVIFGWLRAATMPMWKDGTGRVFRKGGGMTLLLWVLTVVVRLGLGLVAETGFGEPFNIDALWMGMGVTLAAQQWVMVRRGASALPVRAAAAAPAAAGG
ncbi:hypothetical protein Q3V23_31460 [Streptomyces sp. VNUA116]|uniref:hypothetical protein n=1 Tax=Streptomyces sp. VNUA116 TaxID=3062449 RepID=UPI0026766450|nr:hypothetical protein [Streptomyces sp. VNUA116]WKU48216.1 hypothetical protein Q3V23_31460 [Streptomyces sp. VNUA116]